MIEKILDYAFMAACVLFIFGLASGIAVAVYKCFEETDLGQMMVERIKNKLDDQEDE